MLFGAFFIVIYIIGNKKEAKLLASFLFMVKLSFTQFAF